MSEAARAPRRRPLAALTATALVVAVGAAALVLFLGGRSGREHRGGALAWVGRPRLMVAPGNPHDRILTATVRNDTGEVAEVEARSIHVVDERGRPLQSDGIFLGSFVRGMYSASRLSGASDFERRRTGRLARLAPKETRPLTVAWR